MKPLTKLEKQDYQKYYIEIPDPNFSAKRNQAIIDATIKKYEDTVLKKSREHHDDYAERADAVSSYLKHAYKKPGYRLDHYFEPKYLAFLRGDEIRQELLARMRILDHDGNEIQKKNFI